MSEKLRWCLSKFPALEVAAASAGRYPIGGSDGGRGGLDGGDSHGISTEEHYMKMVEENPGNPLLSRNYAEFLYQTKKDAKKAEEYYSRAILADPNGRFRPPEETVMLKLWEEEEDDGVHMPPTITHQQRPNGFCICLLEGKGERDFISYFSYEISFFSS